MIPAAWEVDRNSPGRCPNRHVIGRLRQAGLRFLRALTAPKRHCANTSTISVGRDTCGLPANAPKQMRAKVAGRGDIFAGRYRVK